MLTMAIKTFRFVFQQQPEIERIAAQTGDGAVLLAVCSRIKSRADNH